MDSRREKIRLEMDPINQFENDAFRVWRDKWTSKGCQCQIECI